MPKAKLTPEEEAAYAALARAARRLRRAQERARQLRERAALSLSLGPRLQSDRGGNPKREGKP